LEQVKQARFHCAKMFKYFQQAGVSTGRQGWTCES